MTAEVKDELSRLVVNSVSARRADERQRRLRPGATDLER